MTTPVDQASRDRIRTGIHESLFIEAGAGTGKTRSLIDRLVYMVDQGIELRNVAAITFTEAAAAELKDRLRQAIEANAAGAPDDERWRRALTQLDAAAIQTLHAFAQRILAAHPLEAGLPPGFQVMDGIQGGLAFEDRWQGFLDDFLGEDGPAELIEVLLGLNAGFDGLRKAARAMHGSWDRLEDIELTSSPRPPVDPADVISALNDALAVGLPGVPGARDTLVSELERVAARVQVLATADTAYAVVRALATKFRTGLVGNRANWSQDQLDQARAALDEAEAARQELITDLSEWCASELLVYLRNFALDYAAERRTQGTLEFHDLLTLARDLLRKDDDVRLAIHRRYRHVLIDEFQDTDPLQIEIASLVVRPPDVPGDESWQQAPVPPGSLVVVGDPKQSIYRFRRADVQLYLAAGRRLGSQPVGLVQNWRSVSSAIHWVNEVFTELIGLESDEDAGQPAYVALEPARDDFADSPHVHWFGAEFPSVEIAREHEARAIADAVQAVRDQGWPVHGHHAGEVTHSPARLADIAILFPRRTVLPYLEREFEARAIPYRVESRSLLYETQDVRDLVHILAALLDPTDEVAVVAALRSPAFACSDRQLLEWRSAGGRWDYTKPQPPGFDVLHPVADAMRWFDTTHPQVLHQPVNVVVEQVIRERRMMELAFAYRRPREHWQRYRFVLEQARAFVAVQGASLRGFVTWMRRQADEGADVVESASPEPDDDAVRLLTIHASKGLEFPIVMLTGLNAGGSRQTPAIAWDHEGRPQLRLGSGDRAVRTGGFQHAIETERNRQEAERLRVLYVGATRARDHLLLSLFRGAKAGTDAHRLAEFIDDREHLWRELIIQPSARAESPRSDIELPPIDRDQWLTRRQSTIEARRKDNVIAATAIAKFLRAEPLEMPLPEEPLDEVRPWKRGRAGTHIGRAVHAVLQTIDLATGDGLEAAARAQAFAEGLHRREREVERLVRSALQSPIVLEAVNSGRYWREIFIAARVEDTLLEGFIDLLFERDDGRLVVVDYKTDAVLPGPELDAAVERYTPQMAAYALALQEQLGREIAECRFVFVNESGGEERKVHDLDAAMARVRQSLRTKN
jgi:ATP-dependent helicase/nuclease subunit A